MNSSKASRQPWAVSAPHPGMPPAPWVVAHTQTGSERSHWARIKRGSKFGISGVLGLGVNQVVLWLLVSTLGFNYLIAAAVGSQASTAAAFLINETWVFRGQGVAHDLRSTLGRLIVFDALNAASLLLRLPVLYVLTSLAHVNYLLSNLVAIGVFMLVRFVVADGWIWQAGSATRESVSGPDDLFGSL